MVIILRENTVADFRVKRNAVPMGKISHNIIKKSIKSIDIFASFLLKSLNFVVTKLKLITSLVDLIES